MPPGIPNTPTLNDSDMQQAEMISMIYKDNLWAAIGLRKKKVKHLPRYARVWLYTKKHPDANSGTRNEEPVGVISTTDLIPEVNPNLGIWVKVGWKWLSSDSNDKLYVKVTPLTRCEYETDLAFGLYKKLRVSRCRIRELIREWRGDAIDWYDG